MDADVTTMDDGTTVITHPLSFALRKLPTYQQWKGYVGLIATHASITAEGLVSYICCGCRQAVDASNVWGVVRSKMYAKRLESLATIRIGTSIRMAHADRTLESSGHVTIEEGHKVVPVTTTGLGCPTCQAKYQKKVSEALTIDKLNAQIAEHQAQIAILYNTTYGLCPVDPGFKVVKTPGKAIPFIKVFEDISCPLCADTQWVWNRTIARYVRCSHDPALKDEMKAIDGVVNTIIPSQDEPPPTLTTKAKQGFQPCPHGTASCRECNWQWNDDVRGKVICPQCKTSYVIAFDEDNAKVIRELT